MNQNPYKAQIIALLHTGMTAGEIAAQIGHGCTRNMVAGFRCRNGGAAIFGRQKRSDTKPALRLASPQPSGGTCKFIAGDPKQRGWKFCGKPTVGRERSWCAAHRRRVFQKAQPAKDARPLRRDWVS